MDQLVSKDMVAAGNRRHQLVLFGALLLVALVVAGAVTAMVAVLGTLDLPSSDGVPGKGRPVSPVESLAERSLG